LSFAPGSLRIIALARDHDRDGFDCGAPALDDYIRRQATQDITRGIARVFVASAVDAPSRILGYYALSAAAIAPADLPVEIARRLPHHPVPAALIGRLAVDRRHAGRGLGRILIADSVLKSDAAAESLGVATIVVDPIDDAARRFYGAFGFREAPGMRRMFLMRRAGRRP
jgi:GNAT superfamily N-acetyltransferase